MNRKIKKVVLHDTGKVDLTYEETLDENGRKDVKTLVGGDVAHADFIEAFALLGPHLATKTEQVLYTDFEENDKLKEQYRATGFTIGGDGDHEGIVITGQRRLSTNEVLNLNTPFIKFHKDHCNYTYIQSLEAELKVILSEADQYLNKTKLAPKAQMELNFDKEDELEEQEEPKDKKVRSIAKKLKKTLDDAGVQMVAQ